jgi:spoIIIJ-associated protein
MTMREFTGKDVNEAIHKACEALSLPREELEIEIVTPGSTSIFGLTFKKAKIRAGIKRAAPQELPLKPEKKSGPRKKAQTKRQPGKTKSTPPEVVDRLQPPMEPLPPAPLQEEKVEMAMLGNTAKKLLEELLDKMGCPSEITISEGGKSLRASIQGEHTDVLTAGEGQILDSIQYLLRKMLSKKFAQKVLISVDAGDFRAARRLELEDLARNLAGEVKQTGKSRSLAAMNPADRRIVHMAIQDEEGIRSRSVGEGIFKKVIIYQPGKGGRKAPPRRRGKRPQQQQS